MDRISIAATDAERILQQHGIEDTVSQVSYVEEGEASDVYTLTGRTGQYILKTYPDKWAVMEKESAMYQLLEAETVTPVPHVYGTSDDHSVIDRGYILMDAVPGRMFEAVSDTVQEPGLQSMYHDLGTILRDIHRVTFDEFGWLSSDGAVQPHESNRAFMEAKFMDVAEFAADIGEDAISATVHDTVEEYAPVFEECTTPHLLHNDYHEGNIIVQETADEAWTVSGVIDVANMTAGDPVSDIARTFYFVEDDTKRDALLDGYGDLPEQWDDRLPLYELHHALDIWKFIHKKYGEDAATNLKGEVTERLSNLDQSQHHYA